MSNSSSPASPPDPVNWQPAFWGLVAVATSTAFQDAGRVLGFAATYHIVLRTSPIVCLLDTIDILAGILFHYKKTDPVVALRLVWRERLEEEPDSPAPLKDKIPLVNWWFQMFLRVMVVLATVKVATFRDLPWTQVFAAVYFAAFVVQEGVNYFGPPKETPTLPTGAAPESVPRVAVLDHWDWIRNNFKHGRKLYWLWNRALPVVLQLSLWNWLLGTPLPEYEEMSDLPFPKNFVAASTVIPAVPVWLLVICAATIEFGCVMLADISTMFLPAGLVGWLMAYTLPSNADWKPLLIAVVCITIIICQLNWFGGLYASQWWVSHHYFVDYVFPWVEAALENANKTFWYRLTSGGWISAPVALAGFIVFVIARHYLSGLQQLASNRAFACLFLVLLTFASALVYYSTSYDPQGTSQAGWAGDLP